MDIYSNNSNNFAGLKFIKKAQIEYENQQFDSSIQYLKMALESLNVIHMKAKILFAIGVISNNMELFSNQALEELKNETNKKNLDLFLDIMDNMIDKYLLESDCNKAKLLVLTHISYIMSLNQNLQFMIAFSSLLIKLYMYCCDQEIYQFIHQIFKLLDQHSLDKISFFEFQINKIKIMLMNNEKEKAKSFLDSSKTEIQSLLLINRKIDNYDNNIESIDYTGNLIEITIIKIIINFPNNITFAYSLFNELESLIKTYNEIIGKNCYSDIKVYKHEHLSLLMTMFKNFFLFHMGRNLEIDMQLYHKYDQMNQNKNNSCFTTMVYLHLTRIFIFCDLTTSAPLQASQKFFDLYDSPINIFKLPFVLCDHLIMTILCMYMNQINNAIQIVTNMLMHNTFYSDSIDQTTGQTLLKTIILIINMLIERKSMAHKQISYEQYVEQLKIIDIHSPISIIYACILSIKHNFNFKEFKTYIYEYLYKFNDFNSSSFIKTCTYILELHASIFDESIKYNMQNKINSILDFFAEKKDVFAICHVDSFHKDLSKYYNYNKKTEHSITTLHDIKNLKHVIENFMKNYSSDPQFLNILPMFMEYSKYL